MNKESVVVRKGFFEVFRIPARVGGSAAFEECRYVRKRNYRRTTPKADSCQYILAQTGVSQPADLKVRHIPQMVAFMRVKVVAKRDMSSKLPPRWTFNPGVMPSAQAGKEL